MRAKLLRTQIWWVLVCGSAACKDQGETTDSAVDEGDADADADSDADADADADADSDADTDVDPCWVADPSGHGKCFDVTVSGCAFPTAPVDSDGDGEKDSLIFLNQCPAAGVQSADFDNAARVPPSVWTPGDPLPPVP